MCFRCKAWSGGARHLLVASGESRSERRVSHALPLCPNRRANDAAALAPAFPTRVDAKPRAS
eukprot:13006723-Alexandrium_andersonii.AAC.1